MYTLTGRNSQTCEVCRDDRPLQEFRLQWNMQTYYLGKICRTCRKRTKVGMGPDLWPNDPKERLRAEFLYVYGGKCGCCDETNPAFLTLEHLDGSGREHRERVGTGIAILRDLRRRGWPEENIALACFNCNMGRERFEDKVCPHRRRDAGQDQLHGVGREA